MIQSGQPNCLRRYKEWLPQNLIWPKRRLRRIFIKPDGMASDNECKEACFNTVGFGDVLGRASPQAAISDCSERFISTPTRNIVQNSIYMDDLLLGADEDIDQKIKEVDSGLK